MKALEKDRNRRYESASDLAADIARYINNEQVQACPPSKWYQLTKLAHRHRVLLATSCLVAVSLLAGITASLWQAIRAMQAEQRAVAGGALARQAVDEMYTEVAEQWLEEKVRFAGSLPAVVSLDELPGWLFWHDSSTSASC